MPDQIARVCFSQNVGAKLTYVILVSGAQLDDPVFVSRIGIQPFAQLQNFFPPLVVAGVRGGSGQNGLRGSKAANTRS